MLEIEDKNKKILEENKEILDQIEEWISTQPHIPKTIPRVIMFRFYKVCHCDLEETKKLIDINVKFRKNHQYFLANRDINSEELQRAIKNVQFVIFPKLTKEGYSIELYKISDSNVKNFILKDIFKLVILINDGYCIMEPNTNGLVSIYDASGFTFSHFLKFISNLQSVTHFSKYGEEAFGVDLKQVHFINCSSILTKTISMLKPLISTELSRKFQFHTSGCEALQEIFDKDCLPIEFGGSGGTLEEYAEYTLNCVHKYHEFLRRDENFFLVNE